MHWTGASKIQNGVQVNLRPRGSVFVAPAFGGGALQPKIGHDSRVDQARMALMGDMR
jgi:hypothetical protein